ncbi:hypothetical protein [Streptomyces gobiensis]|uniref:hypothetical protein n=1 Tax=Streptomyces gobiensis TaxID=2875706 RepID=UPI001E658EDE|nr:hypothetical protein [Streptomyces gobiensis]UGY91767.1 hypothetical protein test1122_08570 [Streptomyces gobiensis]
MRTLLTARLDTQASNAALKDGRMPTLIEGIMGELKPEAAYFTPLDGRRAFMMIFDLKESAQLPGVTDPLWRELGAEITVQPVMNAEDLKKGLAAVTQGRS